eukprot:TRINITY_DN1561_c1_g1_i1.p1 TRINITY_DN1561_c1_g1~~TRINITY_DN1561_c1_g1_i1.p1  ORF type:complete len:352 (+),score=145.65 TRINITY_DN1561_c1_g1_i1:47-1057(+)
MNNNTINFKENNLKIENEKNENEENNNNNNNEINQLENQIEITNLTLTNNQENKIDEIVKTRLQIHSHRESSFGSSKFAFANQPINIRLLGDESVGKSSFIMKLENKVDQVYNGGLVPDATINVTINSSELIFAKKNTNTDTDTNTDTNTNDSNLLESESNNEDIIELQVEVNLWDTPKWLRWDDADVTVLPSELDALIVLFDLTNARSFANVGSKWLKWISHNIQEEEDDSIDSEAPILLVGTKSDTNQLLQIDSDQLANVIKQAGTVLNVLNEHYEVSCRTGSNVDIALKAIIRSILQKKISQNSNKIDRLKVFSSSSTDCLNVVDTTNCCLIS